MAWSVGFVAVAVAKIWGRVSAKWVTSEMEACSPKPEEESLPRIVHLRPE